MTRLGGVPMSVSIPPRLPAKASGMRKRDDCMPEPAARLMMIGIMKAHRSGIAHEGSNKGGYEHHQQEGDGFIAARECHQLPVSLARPVCMMAPPTTKSPIIMTTMGERSQPELRLACKDSENQECCQGCERHDIGSHLAPKQTWQP